MLTSRIRLVIVLVLVAACGGPESRAPSQLDNACAIVAQRPAYLRAMERVEDKWGAPVPVLMAMIYQESKFRATARTPVRYTLGVIPMGRQSSAYGYSQALDATWEEYQTKTGRRSAKRDRITDATDFMGWYMTLTVERNGVALTDTRNQYLAYHEGHSGFARQSYNAKSWLVRIAGEVADRAVMYDAQLRACGRRN